MVQTQQKLDKEVSSSTKLFHLFNTLNKQNFKSRSKACKQPNKKVSKITFILLENSRLPDISEEEQACVQKIN